MEVQEMILCDPISDQLFKVWPSMQVLKMPVTRLVSTSSDRHEAKQSQMERMHVHHAPSGALAVLH